MLLVASINKDSTIGTTPPSREGTLLKLRHLHKFATQGLSPSQFQQLVEDGASVAAIHQPHPGQEATWQKAQHLCIIVPDDPEKVPLIRRHAAFYQRVPEGYRVWYTFDRPIPKLNKWRLLLNAVAWKVDGTPACDGLGMVDGFVGEAVRLGGELSLEDGRDYYVLEYKKRDSRKQFEAGIGRVDPPLTREQHQQIMDVFDDVVSKLTATYDEWHLKVLERYGIEPNEYIPLYGIEDGDLAFVYPDGVQIEVINLEGATSRTEVAALAPVVNIEYDGYSVAVAGGALPALEAHKYLGASIIENKMVRFYALSDGEIGPELLERLREMVVVTFDNRPLPEGLKGVRAREFYNRAEHITDSFFVTEARWAQVSDD